MNEYATTENMTESGKFQQFCDLVFSFFAYIGDSIREYPNKFFYLVLVLLCFIAPLFSFLIIISLLCSIYRRETAWQLC